MTDPAPDDEMGSDMPAPWDAFPTLPYGHIGWRMGDGEQYFHDWCRWWQRLSREQRERYRRRHPEPAAWKGFLAERVEDE